MAQGIGSEFKPQYQKKKKKSQTGGSTVVPHAPY
jgi:hypothetical protein